MDLCGKVGELWNWGRRVWVGWHASISVSPEAIKAVDWMCVTIPFENVPITGVLVYAESFNPPPNCYRVTRENSFSFRSSQEIGNSATELRIGDYDRALAAGRAELSSALGPVSDIKDMSIKDARFG